MAKAFSFLTWPNLSLSPPDAHGIAQGEQLRMVWSHSLTGIWVATLFAAVMAWGLRGDVASNHLVDAWLIVKVAVSIFRWTLGRRFVRQPSDGEQWQRATLIALVLDGAVWGAAGLYVSLTAPWTLASFVTAVLAGISCVATFGLQVSARCTAGYSVPILALTALGLFLRGEALGELGGLGLLLLLGLQLATAVRSERRVTEGVRLRVQAEALAQEKEDALKTAMRQSAVKTQFLANMSHELRTPLHGILGMARLLMMEVREPNLVHRVELIQSSGTHLLGLINDLLDISRIESGRFVIRSERFDLKTQVAQLEGVYTVRAQDKGLLFDLQMDLPDPCWVMGDPARFRQVLHNLLGNAIKFTQRGEILLKVTRDADTGMVRAEVADTGVGIAPEDQCHIFEAFRQSDAAAASHASEGVGLGLSIARDIARAMGGDITVQSRLGMGTAMVFTAHLPSAELALDHAQQAAAQPFVSAVAHGLILLAEDNDISALVTCNFLEIIGTQCERVKDGREAVRHALRETNRPDMILMDCHMPVMNGYDATRMIRDQEAKLGLAHIPIVALTATAGDADRQECLDAGMDDFLSKPCQLEDLASMIQLWTSRQQVRQPGDPPQPDGLLGAESLASPGASLHT